RPAQRPRPTAPPRSLPDAVLKVIAAHLDVFEERCGISERRITELLIDTGRRPDEICTLRWDCLERDSSGSPALIYTDTKNHRPAGGCPSARPPPPSSPRRKPGSVSRTRTP